MKNCEKCDKKIKNGFKMCYSCNDSKATQSPKQLNHCTSKIRSLEQ